MQFAPLVVTMVMPALVVAAFGRHDNARATTAAAAPRFATPHARQLVAATATPVPMVRVAAALPRIERAGGAGR